MDFILNMGQNICRHKKNLRRAHMAHNFIFFYFTGFLRVLQA